MDDADLTRQLERAFRRFEFRYSIDDLVSRRRRVPVLVPSLATAAGAVLLAVVVWAASTSSPVVGPTIAFSDWKSVPAGANADFVEAAAERCHIEPNMNLVAHDQRGTAAVLAYAGGGDLTLCLVAKDSAGTIVTAASGSTHLQTAAGPLSVDTGLSAPATSQSTGVRIMAGRASSRIASVVVARSDGLKVTATVSAGYWVAWWPTPQPGTTVTSTDSQGDVVQVLPALN